MTLINLFSDELKSFFLKIEMEGFTLTLVGGAVRDFYKDKTLSKDLDFEVRNLPINQLIHFFTQEKIIFEVLPYSIVRVKINEFDCEFSGPRKEIPIYENKTHHHFNAEINEHFSYIDSFKRRDFSINAIGVEFNFNNNNEIIIDPFKGINDLSTGLLKKISDEFFLDSVRFLRCIRFEIKYGFTIDDEILNNLKRFNLTQLSEHFFIEEMNKSLKKIKFIQRFISLVNENNLELPKRFLFLEKLNFINLSEDSTLEHLLFNVLVFNPELTNHVRDFFHIQYREIEKINSFLQSYDYLKRNPLNNIFNQNMVSMDKMNDMTHLIEIKNFIDKKAYHSYVEPFDYIRELIIILEKSKVDINLFDPKFRSLAKIYRGLSELSTYDKYKNI